MSLTLRSLTRLSTLITALVASVGGTLLITAQPAAAAVSGLVVVTNTSGPNSSNKSVSVACPVGKRVINAGGFVSGGGGKVILDDILPDPLLGAVTAHGMKTDLYTVPWSITAVATCAVAPSGLQFIQAASDYDDTSVKTATAQCPVGKKALGTGASLEGTNGEVWVDEIWPDGGPGLGTNRVDVLAVAGDPYPSDWRVRSYAICAYPLLGQQTLTEQTASDNSNKGITVSCPAGQVATGSGVKLLEGFGEVVIVHALPYSTAAVAVYGEVNDGSTANWAIRAYVNCVDG